MDKTARPVARAGDTVPAVYERLRDLIVDGEFAPGQRLTQAELGALLEVGRTPLREALRMLESDGLVSSGANSGVRVTRVELGDAEELYAVRLLVEPPLLASVADELTAADLRELHEMLDVLRGVGRRHREFHRLHLDFHIRTYHTLSPVLLDLITSLSRRVFWLQRVYMSRVPVAEDFLAVDERLLEALADADGERAHHLHELHMIDAAIGLVTDVEPDHRFGRLIKTAARIGIEIETDAEGRVDPPVALRFTRLDTPPHFETQNVRVAAD